MSNPHGTTGGANPSDAIALDETDTDSASITGHDLQLDSDSEDGGMQIDTQPDENLFARLMQERAAVSDTQNLMLSRSDDSDFSIHPPDPFSTTPNPHNAPIHSAPREAQGQDQEDPSHDQERPPALARRNRLREEEHAALSVLNNWELLVSHAINSRRTIPQTKRYFLAKLLAPENPAAEKDLYAVRFTVPASRSDLVPGIERAGPDGRQPERATGPGNVAATLVQRDSKEVISRNGDGWWSPGQRKAQRGKKGTRAVSGSGGNSRVGSRSVSRG
ncbi:uncharacterized protein N7459_008981 [Penicillium hispanicum]|uniref:uncharacterized protein n=1 Tax=Penicillium hispanicum TaxID=1080232 RepID=UPI00253F7E31|nr:uncharacterized protein N7459_008981 [Penicillium hispanicum]KAJ5569551.1 hypothetical protein N7459_008981 [Penicillium hispanicum]